MNQQAFRHNVKNYLQAMLLLLLGCVLFYLAVRKQQWSTFLSVLQSGNYGMVPLILVVSMASYWFRNERWRLLVDSTGYHVHKTPSLAALSVGYLVNYGVPRLGELTRCYLIKRRQQVPFELSLGTVVAERVVDILMLVGVVLAALILQFEVLSEFVLQRLWPLFYINQKVTLNTWMFRIVTLAILIAGLYGLLRWAGKRISNYLNVAVFADGLKSMFRVKHRITFAGYTLGIWICYFLMTYLWSFSFDSTKNMGMLQAFIVMTAGTLGRSLPIQGGGFGAYHFMVTQALLIYGVEEENGFALAVLIHAGQMIFSLLMGVWGYLYFGFTQNTNT